MKLLLQRPKSSQKSGYDFEEELLEKETKVGAHVVPVGKKAK